MGSIYNNRLKRLKPLSRGQSGVSYRRNYKVNSEKTKPIRFKSIEKISARQEEKLKIYYKIRVLFLELFTECEAKLPGCQHIATEIHHREGRGKYLLTIKKFLPVCRCCHDQIGDSSEKSICSGLSFRRNRSESRYLQPEETDTKEVFSVTRENFMKIIAKLFRIDTN